VTAADQVPFRPELRTSEHEIEASEIQKRLKISFRCSVPKAEVHKRAREMGPNPQARYNIPIAIN
jgi:hypothetical protein